MNWLIYYWLIDLIDWYHLAIFDVQSVETFPLFPHGGTDQLICHVAIDLWSTGRMCAQKTVALQATKLQSVSECVIRVWAF